MNPNKPRNPGKVEWSGDNPGIYLKEDPAGDWSALGIFFRVTYSPFGSGHVAIALEKPNEALGYPQVKNLCLWDNEELTQYLIDGYVSKFPSFLGKKGLDAMTHIRIDDIYSRGDFRDHHTEIIMADDVELVMYWGELDTPFAAEVAKEASATGEHEMYSVFFEAKSAYISVNGERFNGQLTSRQFFGAEMSTAFLAISETWLQPGR